MDEEEAEVVREPGYVDELSALVDSYVTMRGLEEETKARAKEVQEYVEKAKQALIDGMVNAGIRSITSEVHNASFSVTNQRFINVKKEHDLLLHAWLEAHGLGSVIQTTVNRNTLKSTMASFVDDNPEEELPEFFKEFTKANISMRKKKG